MQEFVEIKAQAWLNFYSDWLENNPTENILVLHYENIKQSLKYVARLFIIFIKSSTPQALPEEDCRFPWI